jgi:hypothetical protein
MEEGVRVENATLLLAAALEPSEILDKYDLTRERPSRAAGHDAMRRNKEKLAFPMRVLLRRRLTRTR